MKATINKNFWYWVLYTKLSLSDHKVQGLEMFENLKILDGLPFGSSIPYMERA